MYRSSSQQTAWITLVLALIVGGSHTLPQDGSRNAGSQDEAPTVAPAGEELTLAGLVTRLRALDAVPVSRIWQEIRTLNRLARESPGDPVLLLIPSDEGLTGNARLGAAALLLERRALHQEGQIELQRIANEGESVALRVAALRLLGKTELTFTVLRFLETILNADEDESIRLEVTRAALTMEDGNNKLRRRELEAFLGSPRRDIQERAALALAEVDDFRPPVGRILRELSQEPTDNGQLASRLLERPPPVTDPTAPLLARMRQLERENRRLRHRLEQGPQTKGDYFAVFAEALQLIHKRGLFGRPASEQALVLAGLEGMAASIDPYGHILSADDLARIEGREKATDWRLGMRIVPSPDAPPIVAGVRADGPAARAGLRSGDRILEVNGAPTAGATRSELRTFLTSRDDQKFQLQCASWGSPPRKVVLSGELLAGPSLTHRTLPHGIGYVQLPRFVPSTAAEVAQAIEELDRQGARVLLLDLRDNPGGDLEPAAQTVDLLVEDHRAILTQVFAGNLRVARMAERAPLTGLPIVVLVNRFTASAAEVVAAALQDFDRAKVVGEPTYGKGLGQVLLKLPASEEYLDDRAALLMTDRRLYRPSGESLERGVQPDAFVAGEREALGIDDFEELERVMYSPQVYNYLDNYGDSVQKALAAHDVWDPSEYRQLDALGQELHTPLGGAALSYAIRRLQRQRLTESQSVPAWANDSGDDTLHAALRIALEALGENLAELPEYAHLAKE